MDCFATLAMTVFVHPVLHIVVRQHRVVLLPPVFLDRIGNKIGEAIIHLLLGSTNEREESQACLDSSEREGERERSPQRVPEGRGGDAGITAKPCKYCCQNITIFRYSTSTAAATAPMATVSRSRLRHDMIRATTVATMPEVRLLVE